MVSASDDPVPEEAAGPAALGSPSAASSPAGAIEGPDRSLAPFALPDRRAVLAASAPWLGAVLNVLPGLGAGYLYQRRWRAWWITSLLGAGSLAIAGRPQNPAPLSQSLAFQTLSLALLLLLALVTAVEAFLAARRARMG